MNLYNKVVLTKNKQYNIELCNWKLKEENEDPSNFRNWDKGIKDFSDKHGSLLKQEIGKSYE